MFIETLEFTIPVDLCSLFTTLQKSTQSDVEFPASVNSYGTTQDASIQVALRANKLTFKVDGVSSNASIISKSECKTLKLSVFDVDRSLIPQENLNFDSHNVSNFHHSSPAPASQKRTYDSSSTPVRAKIRRNSGDSNRKKSKSPNADRISYSSHTTNSGENTSSNALTIKTEPEDPDLIEIDPDPEPIKTELQESQSDNSLSIYQQNTPSSLYERNVPHVQDYAEPSTSKQHNTSQSVDDFLVFQDDTYDGEDNEDYSNDDGYSGILHGNPAVSLPESNWNTNTGGLIDFNNDDIRSLGNSCRPSPPEITMCLGADHNIVMHRTLGEGLPLVTGSDNKLPCRLCEKSFATPNARKYHYQSVHEKKTFSCVCGKVYKYHPGLFRHIKDCPTYLMANKDPTSSFFDGHGSS